MDSTSFRHVFAATGATLVLSAALAGSPGSAVANQGHDEEGSGLDRDNVLEIIARHPPGGEADDH